MLVVLTSLHKVKDAFRLRPHTEMWAAKRGYSIENIFTVVW